MAIKVVVLDGGQLPADVEFPPLELEKYGWEQYPQLSGEDIAERCWRADIVVTLGTHVDRGTLEKMAKIGLLICAGKACAAVDQEAATARGVEILGFPDADLGSAAAAQDLCNRVSAAINHYLRTSKQQEADI
jgi:phosphoglycerate dehydrogenase-like enzyme